MPSNLNVHRKVSFKRKDVASWTYYCHVNIKSIQMKYHYFILYFPKVFEIFEKSSDCDQKLGRFGFGLISLFVVRTFIKP